jgi:hypothetical protein
MAERNVGPLQLWCVRAVLVLLFVPGLIWAALESLWTEIKPVPSYVWWDCCEFVSGAKFVWRTGREPEEGEW